jgi:hypothetical protein
MMSNLIQCSDCTAEISPNAAHCPKCGATTGIGPDYAALHIILMALFLSASIASFFTVVSSAYLLFNMSIVEYKCRFLQTENTNFVIYCLKVFFLTPLMAPVYEFFPEIDLCSSAVASKNNLFGIWKFCFICATYTLGVIFCTRGQKKFLEISSRKRN